MPHPTALIIGLLTFVLVFACQPSPALDGAPKESPPVEGSPPAAMEEEDLGLPPQVHRGLLEERARQAWVDIGNVPHQCASYDYFPSGGMYTAYCRLKNFGSFGLLEEALGITVFRSGPHSDGQLDLDSDTSFGHYHPDFVLSLTEWALPALHDEAFLHLTRGIYETYFRPLARVYWMSYRKLREHPDYWDQEQVRLSTSLQGGLDPFYYENFFYFLNPRFLENPSGGFEYFVDRGFDGDEYDGNVIKTAVGFWIRRGIDETAELFAEALSTVLTLYDQPFLDRNR
jgi:hypothetical protein